MFSLVPRGLDLPEVSPWHPHNAPAHQPLQSSQECRGGGRWDHNTEASARRSLHQRLSKCISGFCVFLGPFKVRPKIFCNNAKSAALLFFQVCAVEFFRGYNTCNEPSRPTVGAGMRVQFSSLSRTSDLQKWKTMHAYFFALENRHFSLKTCYSC